MALFGAVEIGGTHTNLAVGVTPDDLMAREEFNTTLPEDTLQRIIGYFAEHPVDAVGVACFGPLQLGPGHPSYGTMRSTPKPGWSGTPVHARLSAALAGPVAMELDVNGAALGEGRWGAAMGMDHYSYVTVGTGIGGGSVVGGRPIGGERHPEMGHIAVSRMEGDGFLGRCPYHGACLEGMASGPALEDRFGRPGSWAGNDRVLDLVTHYLAQGMANLVYTVAPERIIVGGGVTALPGFHARLRKAVGSRLNDYPGEPDLDLLISKPGLGDLSGLAGGLVLAERVAA